MSREPQHSRITYLVLAQAEMHLVAKTIKEVRSAYAEWRQENGEYNEALEGRLERLLDRWRELDRKYTELAADLLADNGVTVETGP